DDRLDPAAGGAWSVQLLDENALGDFSRVNFQELLNARAAVTLIPSIGPSDLGRGQVNSWSLDAASRNWLEQRILDGVPAITVRISGPAGGTSTVFAWDSGYGPVSRVNPPQLVLSFGAQPGSPPALPTRPQIIVTQEPTPQNVATAAARVLTATRRAANEGTPTPLPYETVLATPTLTPVIVTYTPRPANALTATAYADYATAVALTTGTFTPLPTENVLFATHTPTPLIVVVTPTPRNVLTAAAQALTAVAEAARYGTSTPLPPNAILVTGIPPRPIITFTPTPANALTATADSAYATAVALTTGTFTPLPADAMTPQIILPTPMPENVLTAAARALSATAQVGQSGTATALPAHVVVATVTPLPIVLTPTPRPANAATAFAHASYATAVAITTGTFTPLPPNAVTATPVPLIVWPEMQTPTVQPTPTSTPGASIPPELVGKILFISDRPGLTDLFALDPATGGIALVTQMWPYELARQQEARSPDGLYDAVVFERLTEDDMVIPEIQIRDNQYDVTRPLPGAGDYSYDPSWSPRADRIAFVSMESGNDEIYVISREGGAKQRLTFNSWQWDKHPSWSPDGTQIAFWSNRETGRRQLWIMGSDGSNQRRLLDSPYNDWDPIWVK
ncbi:MAG: hypothetical protein GX616_01980, partial [Planctomycetes bacterium]|nr:hypothetical protein [Planctomycetota bacterium]